VIKKTENQSQSRQDTIGIGNYIFKFYLHSSSYRGFRRQQLNIFRSSREFVLRV
jgi:hypothetical protein